jgi:hypothetical protein
MAARGIPPNVAINGIAETVCPRGTSANLEAMIYATARSALAASGVERADVDAIVISASDQTDGRAISSMLTAGPAGAYLNDEINVASSPGHALALACLMIRSGRHRRVLLSSWGRAGELTTEGGSEAAERLSFDPYYERHALTSSAVLAIQAAAQRARPRGEEGARAVVARNRPHAEIDPTQRQLRAHPLRADEVAPEHDGAFSIVLSGAGAVSVDEPVWIHGLGWACDGARVADRDLVGLPHLRSAGHRAAASAGLATLREADDFELHDYTADAELLAIEALRLCEDGEAPGLAADGFFEREGGHPVSPAGGSLAGEAPFGGPLRKVVAAVRQVRGLAGDAQVPGCRCAVAQIAGGIAGQFQTVVVLGCNRPS